MFWEKLPPPTMPIELHLYKLQAGKKKVNLIRLQFFETKSFCVVIRTQNNYLKTETLNMLYNKKNWILHNLLGLINMRIALI